MEARNVPIFQTIAVLSAKTSPALGWDVTFDRDLTDANIKSFTRLVENCLNEYLQSNVNVAKNNLVTPFTCRLLPTGTNPFLYNFKVQVFRKFIFFKLAFPYPPGPIMAVDHFVLVKGPGVESQTSSVALKPPSPVN